MNPYTKTGLGILREGDAGPLVAAMQRIVHCTATGVWDELTTRAVMVWRAARKMPAIATWDAECWKVAKEEEK